MTSPYPRLKIHPPTEPLPIEPERPTEEPQKLLRPQHIEEVGSVAVWQGQAWYSTAKAGRWWAATDADIAALEPGELVSYQRCVWAYGFVAIKDGEVVANFPEYPKFRHRFPLDLLQITDDPGTVEPEPVRTVQMEIDLYPLPPEDLIS